VHARAVTEEIADPSASHFSSTTRQIPRRNCKFRLIPAADSLSAARIRELPPSRGCLLHRAKRRAEQADMCEPRSEALISALPPKAALPLPLATFRCFFLSAPPPPTLELSGGIIRQGRDCESAGVRRQIRR